MSFAENLQTIQQRIRAACLRAGREEKSVTLLAVSKSHPPDTIHEAVDAGQIYFGENKIQEAKAKIPLSPGKARWHFIGHLQSNKVRDAVGLFEMIQGVDSLEIATEISRRADQAAKTMPILLEVNVAGEASKFGYAPERLLAELERLNALPRIEIHGLMAIPPFVAVPEKARPYFKKLRELRTGCEKILGVPLPHLSMGMSGDFEIAIEEGATLVRVGTALFGERQKTVRATPDQGC
ncbi:MAG TPA: YggS family pyridoxal phosphate-dependent enzyme [Candidatus Sulfotelmatobacter sp.]|nr:YggS family pyridoxal phosphate-dependent enzyme [Candidatus Sulfotelmatobacter sp.]